MMEIALVLHIDEAPSNKHKPIVFIINSKKEQNISEQISKVIARQGSSILDGWNLSTIAILLF
jgi:hypothetical protein